MFTVDSVDHSDFLRTIRGLPGPLECRWFALLDQLIECQVQIKVLCDGAIDALALRIIRHVENGGSSDLNELAAAVSLSTRPGRRVVSEIAGILCRAGYIARSEEQGILRFYSVKTAPVEDAPSRSEIIERSFRFIPASARLGPDIPGLPRNRLLGLPYHEVAWGDFLSKEVSIEQRIVEACSGFYSGRPVVRGWGGEAVRSEILQRSWLKTVDTRFMDASVVEMSESPFWIIHRCYLFRNQSLRASTWNIEVYRFPVGPREVGYARSLRDWVGSEAANIDHLVAASAPIEVGSSDFAAPRP